VKVGKAVSGGIGVSVTVGVLVSVGVSVGGAGVDEGPCVGLGVALNAETVSIADHVRATCVSALTTLSAKIAGSLTLADLQASMTINPKVIRKVM
jgi:hypothetical protein